MSNTLYLPPRWRRIGFYSLPTRGEGSNQVHIYMSQSTASDVLIALTTCPDGESGQKKANALVTEHLAACVNQIPGIHSTYLWKGELQNDTEVLLVIKTTIQVIYIISGGLISHTCNMLYERRSSPVQVIRVRKSHTYRCNG